MKQTHTPGLSKKVSKCPRRWLAGRGQHDGELGDNAEWPPGAARGSGRKRHVVPQGHGQEEAKHLKFPCFSFSTKATLDKEHSGDVGDEGERVKARRQRLGMHVTDLAREAGVNRNTLSALEAGSSFNRTTLTKVERVLDQSETECGLGPPVPDTSGLPKVVVVRLKNKSGEVVVEGPVADLPILEAAAGRLLREMGQSAS